jgi:hypothetical protein
MIGVGVLALALAVIDCSRTVNMLQQQNGTQYRSLTGRLAALIVLLGLGLLIVVLLRL